MHLIGSFAGLADARVCVRLCVSSERSERVANFHGRIYIRRRPITGAMAMKSLSL